MATFNVTNAADSGAGSLRAAIAQANANAGADTITFDAAVFNGEAADRIRLTTGALAVTDTLTIDGGAAGVTITGDALGNDVTNAQGITDVAASQAGPDRLADNTRILDAGFATALTLRHLTLTGGHTGGYNDPGGAVRAGDLTISDSTLAGNSTAGGVSFGGAAFNNGTASLTNVTLSGNVTTGTQAAGGGIYTAGALTLTNSTVTGNSTAGAGATGGGAYGSQLTLVNSIVLGNATTAAGTGGDEVAGGFSGPLTLLGGNILGKGGGAADIFTGATDIGDTAAAAVFAATTAGPGGTLAGVLADHGGPVETVAL
ncbi:MAG: hypothetical protein K2X74_07860, partial [Acetobacteraceae bacterium]|nr:hypothetical protein [Acetobacteraceae bacterium]